MSTPHRKPRIALMGEFSAGKSTLSNLLLGARPLPERVTATRLSPVWMSKGTQAPYRVDIDGHEEPIAIENLGQIPVDETRVIRLFFEADILDMCDLIDFPGISDPNMSADVWQRMLEEVDAVIWCTHATQAWRQSEAAVWETIPHAVRQHSALLVTKFDKLKTERDQYRVTARLKKETDGLFEAMFPISLTRALAAGDDYAAFKASGGIAFLQYFLGMVEKLQGKTAASEKSLFAAHADALAAAEPVAAPAPAAAAVAVPAAAPVAAPQTPAAQAVEPSSPEPAPQGAEAPAPAPSGGITPRRVRAAGGGRRARPRPGSEALDMSKGKHTTPRPAAKSGNGNDLRAIFQQEPVHAPE